MIQKSINSLRGKILKKEEEKVEPGFFGKLINQYRSEEGYLNIKPLINMTINTFGIFDNIDHSQPFDAKDTKRLFHSMFQMWSPGASNWASRVSKSFKHVMTEEGETRDVGSVEVPEMEERRSFISECGCNRTILAERTKVRLRDCRTFVV